MFQEAAVLFIHAESPLHPGSGSGLGPVDLPIQREVATRFPMVQAPGVRQPLRAVIETLARAMPDGPDRKALESKIDVVFGQRTVRGQEPGGQGHLAMSDARILLLPVASLVGVFAWVTCPYVLDRFRRDLAHLGLPGNQDPLPKLDTKQLDDGGWAIAPTGSAVVIGASQPSAGQGAARTPASQNAPRTQPAALGGAQGGPLAAQPQPTPAASGHAVLGEFAFPVVFKPEASHLAAWLAERIVGTDPRARAWKERIARHTLIIPDTDFRDLTVTAVEVVTRIRMEPDAKRVADGGMWQEENLPAETVLYSMAFAASPRLSGNNGVSPADATGVLDFVATQILKDGEGVIQMGGDETVGRGLARLRLYPWPLPANGQGVTRGQ